jgi:hypothetical protein
MSEIRDPRSGTRIRIRVRDPRSGYRSRIRIEILGLIRITECGSKTLPTGVYLYLFIAEKTIQGKGISAGGVIWGEKSEKGNKIRYYKCAKNG